MKVQFVDNVTPRSDGKPDGVTDLTLFKEYTVAAIEGDKYVIVADNYKLCRFNQSRFLVTDTRKVQSVREAYNYLTWPLRMEVKRLRELVTKLQAELQAK